MFKVPSSDPPSTPDSRRGSQSHTQGPSTTPAGPPPTGYTAQSFTPAGPPPASSIFDDSYMNNNFGATGAFSNFGQSNLFPNSYKKPPTNNQPNFKPSTFGVPSSPPQAHDQAEGDMNGMDEDGSDGYSEEDDGESMFAKRPLDFQSRPSQPTFAAINSHNSANPPLTRPFGAFDNLTSAQTFPATSNLPSKHAMSGSQTYSDYESPRGLKRSRYGQVMGNTYPSSRASRLDARQSAVATIAKGFAKPGPPSLDEPDDVILRSDQILGNMDAEIRGAAHPDLDSLSNKTVQQLADVWAKHVSPKSIPGSIGPANTKSNLDKSNYLASLLLRLYHPFVARHNPKTTTNTFGRSRTMDIILQRDPITTVPKSLLDWLNAYHNPFPEDLPEILKCRPAPIAHEKFWDMVYWTILRGDIATAISLLEDADFTQADTAMDDGYDEPGYYGKQAEAARHVTLRCAELLRSCPAYTDGDWDVKNSEWAIFRNLARQELQNLEAFAESESKDRGTDLDGDNNVFNSSAMGLGRNGLSFSTASRRAESKVPWSVYQNLKIVYGQLQGSKDEIAVCTQDWLETAIYMTIWWDGEDDDQPVGGNMHARRRSTRHSQQIRPVDVSPTTEYRKQLLYAFATLTDDPEDTVFSVNTADPLQVGLACICEGDVAGVVGILQGWSLPLASAVVEIASAAHWLPQAGPGAQGLLDGFDDDDLMVLNHGQDEQSNALKRDEILTTYADQLAIEDRFASADGKMKKEGWNLACRVLSRLDNLDLAKRKTSDILSRLPLDSVERVDRVLSVCADIGLPEQVHALAERYADTLAETSKSYGDALVFYARAHSQAKLKSTVDLLISMCLVQSAAFPPRVYLDSQLRDLLEDQRVTIAKLAKIDPEAARLMATYLSGYATLRRFYDLRDETAASNKLSGLKPFARKQEAGKALLALIQSAADSIRGGLLDTEIETVMQVDTLLALLCEALPLMNQRKTVLTNPQLIIILRAIEDLDSVSPSVYDQAQALFKSAIANFQESPTHLFSSQDLAKSVSGNLMSKSTNSLAASSYAMIGSNGSLASTSTTNGFEAVKVEVKRGWDWRQGALALGQNVGAWQVLRVIRVQIAAEIAKAWTQM